MSQFTFSETLPVDRERAFHLLRDNLPEVAACIPNIKRVTCLERRKEGSKVWLTNRWEADYSIPRIAQRWLKPEMMTWIDRNVWDESTWSCEWSFEPGVFTDAVECHGTNTYEPTPQGCVLRSEGVFELSLGTIPGVPRLIAPRANREVAKLMTRLVGPNLAKVAVGLRAYLEREPACARA